MKANSLFLILGVMLLASLACSFTVDLPDLPDLGRVETGPIQTDTIEIARLDDPEETAEITLAFGAGELEIESGGTDFLVEGTARYNLDDLQPEVDVSGNEVRISQGDFEFDGIPNFDDHTNEWSLRLGRDPMTLRITAGAYQGVMELGGLALRGLHVSDGASDVEVSFSEPNTVAMDELRYESGASRVVLSNLANANFSSMEFQSGAGDYTLDFSGDLQQDADVIVESGLSNVTIIVPEGVNARVSFEGGITNIDTHGRWRQSGNDYVLEGDGPSIVIDLRMAAGNVTLRHP